MVKNHLVSVIIPTFNRATVTCRAIHSILAQMYRNLEIVLVDDCSKDWDELLGFELEKGLAVIVLKLQQLN